MKYFFVGLCMGLIIGLIIAAVDPETNKLTPNTKHSDKHQYRIVKPTWRLAGLIPSSSVSHKPSTKLLVEGINRLTDGTLFFRYFEPEDLVPVLKSFDAISSGEIEAAIINPVYFGKKSRSFELLGGFPFGPNINEYLAWYQEGGGKVLTQKLYRRHNMHALICGLTGPMIGGWFKQPVEKLTDLKGKQIATAGFGKTILSRVGAETSMLAPHEVLPALISGRIFGATISTPLGVGEPYKLLSNSHVYFPGWHQQFSITNLIIHIRDWDSLNFNTKKHIETACSANLFESLAHSEGSQFDFLKLLINRGVKVHRWPPKLVKGLKSIWKNELKRVNNSDDTFRVIWNSLENFRSDYSIWRELGYVK